MNRYMTILLPALILLLAPTVAQAGMYKYRKPNGTVIVTNERRPNLELVQVLVEGSSGGGGGTTSSTSSSESTSDDYDSPDDRRARKQARRARSQHRRDSTSKDESAAGGRPVDRNRFDDLIREAAESYDVPFAFIKAVIRVESDFQAEVISPAGAMGLMQLMPSTARQMNVSDPFDPRQNIFGGTKLIRQLIDRYNGDINLILSAYNAGGGAVAKYGGIPYSQTREYVASVYRWYQYYSNAGAEASE